MLVSDHLFLLWQKVRLRCLPDLVLVVLDVAVEVPLRPLLEIPNLLLVPQILLVMHPLLILLLFNPDHLLHRDLLIPPSHVFLGNVFDIVFIVLWLIVSMKVREIIWLVPEEGLLALAKLVLHELVLLIVERLVLCVQDLSSFLSRSLLDRIRLLLSEHALLRMRHQLLELDQVLLLLEVVLVFVFKLVELKRGQRAASFVHVVAILILACMVGHLSFVDVGLLHVGPRVRLQLVLVEQMLRLVQVVDSHLVLRHLHLQWHGVSHHFLVPRCMLLLLVIDEIILLFVPVRVVDLRRQSLFVVLLLDLWLWCLRTDPVTHLTLIVLRLLALLVPLVVAVVLQMAWTQHVILDVVPVLRRLLCQLRDVPELVAGGTMLVRVLGIVHVVWADQVLVPPLTRISVLEQVEIVHRIGLVAAVGVEVMCAVSLI